MGAGSGVLSGQTIRRLNIVRPCMEPFKDHSGNSCGLSVCGYDITVDLFSNLRIPGVSRDKLGAVIHSVHSGTFHLLSSLEHFTMPSNVVGIVHDKSSLARRGLAVQNTVLEPGWRGHLTIELSNHAGGHFYFYHGDAIAQVIFHFLDEAAEAPYAGKYQDQERGPAAAR